MNSKTEGAGGRVLDRSEHEHPGTGYTGTLDPEPHVARRSFGSSTNGQSHDQPRNGLLLLPVTSSFAPELRRGGGPFGDAEEPELREVLSVAARTRE